MKRILYIDDEPSLRQLVQFMLEQKDNIELLEAETGKMGLQIALEQLPDIILLDVSLPDISGYDVLKKLQDNEPTTNIPVIAVSGNSLPEDVAKGLKAGFHGYLTKPIMVKEFYSLIEDTLDSF